MPEQVPDADLVRRVLAGRVSAYAELVRRWSARVTAVCHARLGRTDAVEDLAQEALLRGLRSLPTLSDPEKFGSWLTGIAIRTCLDWLKSKQRTEVPISSLQAGNDFEETPVGIEDPFADETARLMHEVQLLPHALREAIMLYYYSDVTYRELGDMLGVSAATVNARLTKARALLRERMSEAQR